ncbi:hypothetical protein EKE94_09620 [Mesobaculum littorinae]|uniref:Uncharacterized protein n=1 Tax=Mesobaculum littorinae TaxID=2486419 RepID=A0A438AGA3_9RHOB|nr:hypothetical protein [Mesobaculum littorinae]RVV97741.1 hypothetical protein EKE94_09620 [Mesobaculum littorinae]
MSELMTQFDLYHHQIKLEKDQLLEGLADVFDDTPGSKEPEIQVASLLEKIVQPTLEDDSSSGALEKAGLLPGRKKWRSRPPAEPHATGRAAGDQPRQLFLCAASSRKHGASKRGRQPICATAPLPTT